MQQLKSPQEPATAAGTTSSSCLELLLAALAAGLALWIFLTTVNISRSGWVAIPTLDDWDRWITYVRDHYTLWWFFQQHVDHRLVAPKLLFAVDHLAFHGRGWFLLLCSYCFQALTGIMLWRLWFHATRRGTTERLIIAAAIVSCLFSGQQWSNLVWPFQVQFPMVYCAAAAALVALWKAAEVSAEPDHRSRAWWMILSIGMATIATYSMANGVLTWPVLLIAAVWLRVPRRWIIAIATSALLLGATYFYHWHKSSPYAPLPPSQRLPRAVVFGLAHLGSPIAQLATMGGGDNFRITCAAVVGALVALALSIGFALVWLHRKRYNGAHAILIFYCVFIVGTSTTIAYGRSAGALTEAFSPRYLTPSYILWSGMLLVCWPLLRRMNHIALYSALCAAIFAGIVIHQRATLIAVRNWAAVIRLDETAVIDNVIDPGPWRELFHTPQMTFGAIDYLKANHLTIFTEEWTHWPGLPLNRRFSVDGSPNACQGQFEQTTEVESPLRPGWRVTGWAWDNKAGRSPRYVILADSNGQIAGVALTGFPAVPALIAVSPRYSASTWNGYVNGRARSVTAYVVEADDRSVCAIGRQELQRSGTEVPFSEMGPSLPDAHAELAGVWNKNGYYKGANGPGAPPVEGDVYGSYPPDAGTGTLTLGPFHLDGRTEIAIPLVTGPDSRNLSVIVRDATSRDVYAHIDPAPVHESWWAWRPDLPHDREITIEVVAEDKGTAWGQWQAVGWPHALRQ